MASTDGGGDLNAKLTEKPKPAFLPTMTPATCASCQLFAAITCVGLPASEDPRRENGA